MALSIHNNLTRQKEVFTPLDLDHVRMYVCGPTVYDLAHIGNARPFVIFDVLYRLLRGAYPKVTYARNITDVDDKINAASRASGESIQDITIRTTKAFHDDMAALMVLTPDIEPRATAHIPQMIAMIESLIHKGHAYESQGHVLFAVNTFQDYGALSRRNREDMIAGARVEVAPYKRDPGDFVLWKPSDEETPGWESPWGYGRPGWHIECSAMSAAYLGESFDIHGGGIDLIFPHHENEVAQSRCAHGSQVFARYWMHNGHLMVNGEKMSKSLGNFFTVRDLLVRYDGETIRLCLLMVHYRQPFDWTDDLANQAQQTLRRFYGALKDNPAPSVDAQMDEDVLSALQDDLNTPLALSHLHELVNQLNKATDTDQKVGLAGKIKASGALLGLLQQDPQQWLQNGVSLTSEAIEALIQERRQARENRDFARADEVRQELLAQGVILEDSAQGTTWRRQ